MIQFLHRNKAITNNGSTFGFASLKSLRSQWKILKVIGGNIPLKVNLNYLKIIQDMNLNLLIVILQTNKQKHSMHFIQIMFINYYYAYTINLILKMLKKL